MGIWEAFLAVMTLVGVGHLLAQIEPSAALDWLMHGGQTGACLAIAYFAIKRINRDESLKKDYPPHRHFNGSILYPKEYPPSKIEHLRGDERFR